MNIKLYVSFIALGAVATVFPHFAEAEDGSFFCQKLDSHVAKIGSVITRHDAYVLNTEAKIEENFLKKLATGKERMRQKRAKADEGNQKYKTLLDKAVDTPDQRAKVDVFMAEYSNAVFARRSAIELAQTTMENSLKGIIQDRQYNYKLLSDNYKDGVEMTINKALKACSSESENQTAKDQFVSEMLASKQALNQALLQQKDQKDAIESVLKAYKEAVNEANKQFRDLVIQVSKPIKQ